MAKATTAQYGIATFCRRAVGFSPRGASMRGNATLLVPPRGLKPAARPLDGDLALSY